MKSKSMVLLAVAAGCGLVAMLGVQQMLSSGKSRDAKVRILISKVDIDAGVKLDKTNVGFKEWPKDSVPEGAIFKEDEYAERALKNGVGPGQPIIRTGLGEKGKFGTALQIPDGMQVVSVSVNQQMTHSGLLKPGDYVDITAAIEYMSAKTGGGKRTEVKKVLQCVKIFAVGDKVIGAEEQVDPKAKGPKEVKVVSFLVYPLQAQLLMLADKKSKGNLQLALRSATDKNVSDARDLTEQALTMLSKDLMMEPEELEAPAPSEAPVNRPRPSSITNSVKKSTVPAVTATGDQASRRRTWKIEVFNGDKREVQELDWPEEATASAAPVGNDPSKGWSDPLMKFFSGRPKQEETKPETKQDPQLDSTVPESEAKDAVKHRPSSLIRRIPDASESKTSDKTEDNKTPEEPKH